MDISEGEVRRFSHAERGACVRRIGIREKLVMFFGSQSGEVWKQSEACRKLGLGSWADTSRRPLQQQNRINRSI
jgi:hypothetical protein